MSDNSRIAKNTLFMYIRMGITMFVGLYTSRVVLRVLGVEDYGLYNVIGGIIALFMVLNNALVNTTSRFITVSLAKDSNQISRQIFNMALLMHFCVGVFIVFVGETIGLWYLHNKLVIPEGREIAAEWLYQFTVVAAFLNTVNVPYSASIIAHEKINIYAILQIVDTFLNLGIVLVLQVVPFDKLIFYAALMFLIKAFNVIVNYFYCQHKFQEVKLLFYWNWSKFKEIINFVGWASVGSFSAMFYSQGISLILNAFCGPAVNAARGIASQVRTVVSQLANNVQTAINPQIIKSGSTNNVQRMHMLICASSRYCYYLLLLFILPIMLEADYILHLWLGIVPEHTANFLRLTLLTVLMDAFFNPMFTANLASGKLKMYYIPITINSFSFMVITYFAIKLTDIPESVYYGILLQNIIGLVIRLVVMKKQIQLSPKEYIKKAIIPAFTVSIISLLVPLLSHLYIQGDLLRFVLTTIISLISTIFVVYFFGISQHERQYAIQFIQSKIDRVVHRK